MEVSPFSILAVHVDTFCNPIGGVRLEIEFNDGCFHSSGLWNNFYDLLRSFMPMSRSAGHYGTHSRLHGPLQKRYPLKRFLVARFSGCQWTHRPNLTSSDIGGLATATTTSHSWRLQATTLKMRTHFLPSEPTPMYRCQEIEYSLHHFRFSFGKYINFIKNCSIYPLSQFFLRRIFFFILVSMIYDSQNTFYILRRRFLLSLSMEYDS